MCSSDLDLGDRNRIGKNVRLPGRLASATNDADLAGTELTEALAPFFVVPAKHDKTSDKYRLPGLNGAAVTNGEIGRSLGRGSPMSFLYSRQLWNGVGFDP